MKKQPAHMLSSEDDPALREAVQALLREEGSGVSLAAGLAEADALLGQRTYALILTDTFRQDTSSPLDALEHLLRLAQGTPIGRMTAWNLSAEEVEQRGFACLIKKPYEMEAFLVAIATRLRGEEGGR